MNHDVSRFDALVYRIASGICWVVAAYFFWTAFHRETTVFTPDAVGNFTNVANLQLMHIQAVEFAIAIGATIVGAIFQATASIIQVLARQLQP